MSHTPTLPERLREVSTNIRRMPMPLISFVPLLSKAADEIDTLRRQRDELREALILAQAQIAVLGGTPDPTDPFADQMQIKVQCEIRQAIERCQL